MVISFVSKCPADASLRLTDLADRLRIDAPAVTRKAQRLERMGLVSRGRDPQTTAPSSPACSDSSPATSTNTWAN